MYPVDSIKVSCLCLRAASYGLQTNTFSHLHTRTHHHTQTHTRPLLPSSKWPILPNPTQPRNQTRMQVFATNQAAIYSGVGNAFSRIASTEGLRTLWRGVNSVILGAGPAHAVHFGVYEAVKEITGGNKAGNQFLSTCESICMT